MASTTVTVKPGDNVSILGVPADTPLPPVISPPGPVDPGYSPPWAQAPDPDAPRPSHPIALPGDPWWGTGGGADPNRPRPSHPIALPGDPWWGTSPPTEPPPTEPPPQDSGVYMWCWSPQLQRWVWVKVPQEGEAAPKTA